MTIFVAYVLGALATTLAGTCQRRPSSDVCVPPPTESEAKATHNRWYRLGGGILLAFGLGGFVPSLAMLCYHGEVWSVQHNKPHTNVNVWLILHIIGAITWGGVMVFQLASGGFPSRHGNTPS